MNKASELLKGEKEKPLNLQTLSNRDLVNRLYFARYEDCVDSMKVTMDYNTNRNFQTNLKRLYWSFIMPRKEIMMDVKLDERMSMEDAEKLLSVIGQKMYTLGINRPERASTDPNHAEVEEKEVVG